jgi:periplasmic protein TonB
MKSAPVRIPACILLLACALLASACQSKPPGSAFVPPPPTGILTAAEVDQPPRPAGTQTRADYPVELRRNGVSGSATVRIIVTHDGRVIDATTIRATHPSFGDAAEKAVSKWRYQPAVKDGQPIACLLEIPFTFSLNENRR